MKHSPKQSLQKLTRAIAAGWLFVADRDYRVCGIKQGDLLFYDPKAKPDAGQGLVVVDNDNGRLLMANFLDYATPDKTAVLEWDGRKEWVVLGKAYPVTHVVFPTGGVAPLDLSLFHMAAFNEPLAKTLIETGRLFGPAMGTLDLWGLVEATHEFLTTVVKNPPVRRKRTRSQSRLRGQREWMRDMQGLRAVCSGC
ncbi:MAG TPA: hypothetical protein VI756_02675 [Blastocatellia bacterium]